jgi:hypothetical protein
LEQFGGLLFGQAMFVMQVHIEAKPYKPAKESLFSSEPRNAVTGYSEIRRGERWGRADN